MRVGMLVVGVLLVLMGSIWILQGINVLTAGNSPMIGDIRWAYYGGVAVAIGIALVVVGRRGR
jgi:hypothetical protein